jgi:hypothetical protein
MNELHFTPTDLVLIISSVGSAIGVIIGAWKMNTVNQTTKNISTKSDETHAKLARVEHSTNGSATAMQAKLDLQQSEINNLKELIKEMHTNMNSVKKSRR